MITISNYEAQSEMTVQPVSLHRPVHRACPIIACAHAVGWPDAHSRHVPEAFIVGHTAVGNYKRDEQIDHQGKNVFTIR